MAGDDFKSPCITQRSICKDIFAGDYRELNEKIISLKSAQKVQEDELKRRMHEANDIKKEFSNMMSDLKVKVNTLETKGTIQAKALEYTTTNRLKLVTIGLVALQIIIGIILKVWK